MSWFEFRCSDRFMLMGCDRGISVAFVVAAKWLLFWPSEAAALPIWIRDMGCGTGFGSEIGSVLGLGGLAPIVVIGWARPPVSLVAAAAAACMWLLLLLGLVPMLPRLARLSCWLLLLVSGMGILLGTNT